MEAVGKPGGNGLILHDQDGSYEPQADPHRNWNNEVPEPQAHPELNGTKSKQ